MLLANNTGGGFYAQGSQQFVASAAAGAAIGNAIKAASNFDACMMANGWEIADEGRAAPAPASYASANLNNTAPAANFSAAPPPPTPIYAGGLKNGVTEGHGTATYPDGSKYVGEFKNGVRSGTGVWSNSRGDRYEGEWANDKRNGSGTYFDAGIAVSSGIWRDGEFVKRQAIEPVSTTPVSVTVIPTEQVNTAPPKQVPATVASSKPRPAKTVQRTPISATAAALSAAPPPKLTPTKPTATATAMPVASSSMSAATCTHEQQVQARIAKMNGYTAGPKCD